MRRQGEKSILAGANWYKDEAMACGKVRTGSCNGLLGAWC